MAIEYFRSAVFAAIAIVAGVGLPLGAVIIVVLAVALVAFAFAAWWTTTYEVVDGGLRYRSGVLARRELDVPAVRISALDSSRGVLQRVFGVVALKVQTAGGGTQAEITLRAISHAEAERLRIELGHRSAVGSTQAAAAQAATVDNPPLDASASTSAFADAGEGSPPPATDARPDGAPRFRGPDDVGVDRAQRLLFATSPRDLLLAGLTSPNIALIGAAIGAASGPLEDLLDDGPGRTVRDEVGRLAEQAPVIAVITVLVVAATAAVIGTMLAYWGLRITGDDHRLRIRRGLLTERTSTVPIDRVHGVRIVEQPLRQALGYAAIELDVAGYGHTEDVATTLVPFVKRSELPTLLPSLLPTFAWPSEELQALPPRGRRRYITRQVVFTLPIAVAALVLPIGVAAVVLAVGVIATNAAIGWWQGRTAGFAVDGPRLVIRSRTVARTTSIALIPRLQRRAVTSNPFQARAKLATFRIRLSSRRSVSLRHIERADADRLLTELRPTIAAREGSGADQRSGTPAELR